MSTSNNDIGVIRRRAKKAGSWYSDCPDTLHQQLGNWLSTAGPPQYGPAKAIISPHAGYEYSGKCAGHSYNEIDPLTTRKIFILGPSHRIRLDGVALSSASVYETPIGSLQIDMQIYDELLKTGMFQQMSLQVDQEEHSLELQLPYIKKVMEKCPEPYTIVPMMVGGISPTKEKQFGAVLAKYLAEPGTVFVISSDFCHWGERFDYQYYDQSLGVEIWQNIERLDKLGMQAIKSLSVDCFYRYLRTYDNTICGRHPIGVMLGAIESLNKQREALKYNIKFINYDQSSKCRQMSDSSVSYAAASVKQFGADEQIKPEHDLADV